MFMSREDLNNYPKCAKLLAALAGTVRGQPKVFNAFLDACTADDQTQPAKVAKTLALTKALPWGPGPRIDVTVDIKATDSGKIVEACGYQVPFKLKGRPDIIQITSAWFDAVEFGIVDTQKNTGRLTRTLLHELVHWVRQEAGASDDVQIGGSYKGRAMEAGHYFEQNAFGTPNVCTTDNVLDALLSRRD
jgi:hypothetical protein